MTVLATSMPVTVAREEAVGENLGSNLVRVPCIHYLINFGKKSVSALLDSSSKVNTVHLAFAKELGLSIRPTDIGAQKIDGTTLETYEMIVTAFLVEDKANQVRFFEETFLVANVSPEVVLGMPFLEETFLVANVSPEVVLGMPFLTLSGADVDFSGRELRWRTYTTEEVLPTTRRVELVGKKEFAAAVLDPESETFVVHIVSLSSDASPSFSLLELNVHPSRRPHVSGLIAEEASTKILAKYSDFADVFSPDLASELPEHTEINDHAIKLVNS